MKYWLSVVSMLLASCLLYVLTLNTIIHAKEIDWSKYDLPDIGEDKMWCMFTEYEMVNEERQFLICTYTCQNGMLVNMPGIGRCRRDIQEIRW